METPTDYLNECHEVQKKELQITQDVLYYRYMRHCKKVRVITLSMHNVMTTINLFWGSDKVVTAWIPNRARSDRWTRKKNVFWGCYRDYSVAWKWYMGSFRFPKVSWSFSSTRWLESTW